MKFGLHVSIEGGIDKAPARAFDFGAECFQVFSRSPHGGKAKEIDAEIVKKFRAEHRKYKLGNFYIHTPYYINLASGNNRIYYGSISAIKSELEMADLLGASGVVTHLGSAKDLGEKEAKKKLIEGLCKIFEAPSLKSGKVGYRNFKAKLLLEITAGSGEIMGDTFEEIAFFIKEAEKKIGKDVLGVCFDTAHAFASGYDLSSIEAAHKTFEKFDKIVGIDRIKLVHINDSAAALDSHVDRHANIGNGKIGVEGITATLKELEKYNLDFILETPPSGVGEDLDILKTVIINL